MSHRVHFFQQSYELANNSSELSKPYKTKAIFMNCPDNISNCKEDQLPKEIKRVKEMHFSNYLFLKYSKIDLF